MYTIVAECKNEEDYGRIIRRSEKALEDHMMNNHRSIYIDAKKRRNEYEGDT